MTDAHIIFGSSSDHPVYGRILKGLPGAKLSICSAHRTPEMLDTILDSSHAKVFIAGAGLAAHLPGVIASKTLRPVIGVPVNSNFYGLDSLLSIMQMPKGIPVLTVDIDGENAAWAAKKILSGMSDVVVIGDQKNKQVAECVSMLSSFGVPHSSAEAPSDDSVNILFDDLDDFNVLDDDAFIINVPLKEKSIAMDAVELVELTERGVWVGLNRGDNAALAAVQCLNLDGRHTKKLQAYRDLLREQIISENKKIGGKHA